MDRKPCARCHERPEHISASGKHRSWCTTCLNKANAETKAKDPEKYYLQRRVLHLLKKYNLTQADYETLLDKQGGGCAICDRASDAHRNLAVDHDASTGLVRGILCENCNRAIGQLGHDPERIDRAAGYLRRF